MKRIQRFLLYIIAVIGAGIFLFLTFYSGRYTKRQFLDGESIYSEKDNLALQIVALILATLIVFALGKISHFINDRVLRLVAIVISLLMGAFSISIAICGNLYPYGDQECVYTAAMELFTGEYKKLLTDWYYEAYPFQLGLGQIYAAWFRITGGHSVFRIQCLHAVLTAVTVFVGYQITEELCPKKEVKITYLLAVVCFFPIYLYTNYVYGETWAIMYSLLAVYFFILANKEWKNKYVYLAFWGLVGLCMTAVIIVRAALVIVGIAIIIAQLLISLKKKNVIPVLLAFLCMVVAFGAYRGIKSASEKEIGRDFGGGAPASVWVAMGLQDFDPYDLGPGSNNAYNLQVVMECDFVTEAAHQKAMENIGETLNKWKQNPHLIIPFFKEKALYQWIEPSYGSFYMTRCMEEEHADWIENLYFGRAHDVIYSFLDRYQTIIYVSMLAYFVSALLGKKGVLEHFIGLIVIGGFIYTLLWESKNRYVYPYIVIMMPCVAIGIVTMQKRAGDVLLRMWNKVKRVHTR